MEFLPALANGSGWVAFAVLTLAIFRAIGKNDLVPGGVYRHALKEAAFWRDRALSGTHLAEIATEAAEAQADVD